MLTFRRHRSNYKTSVIQKKLFTGFKTMALMKKPEKFFGKKKAPDFRRTPFGEKQWLS